jgi:hypothetical protein
MPIINITERNAKEFDTIQKKVKLFVKKCQGQCNLGKLEFGVENGVYFITLDNDGLLADDLAAFVKQSPNANLIIAKNYIGTYDWTSDTYARPQSVITFKF